MKKLGIALCLLCLPVSASAGIYKCVINGVDTYQSRVCPASASAADDVSHLESSEPASPPPRVTADRIYNDYRSDVKEIREDYKSQRFIREREREAEKNQRARDKAIEKAEAYNRQQRREKEARDQKWQDDRDRRKARNNGTYEYWDIRTR